VHNTHNHWVWGLCPSSGILVSTTFGNWICSRLQVGKKGKISTLLGPLERVGPVTDVRSKRPRQIMSSFPHLKTETDPVSKTLCFLVPKNSGQWTKSSNPVILTRNSIKLLNSLRMYTILDLMSSPSERPGTHLVNEWRVCIFHKHFAQNECTCGHACIPLHMFRHDNNRCNYFRL
jgi:hypothetical protein